MAVSVWAATGTRPARRKGPAMEKRLPFGEMFAVALLDVVACGVRARPERRPS